MRSFKILIFIFSLSILANAQSDFKFIGKYLLEYSFFKIDVYEISYFKSKDSEKILLDYKIDVKKEHSLEGWRVGLKHKLESKIYAEKAKWLFDNTEDMKSGDKLSLVKKDSEVSIYKNDKLTAQVSDALIAELVFEPWLGEKPVSIELKNALLSTDTKTLKQ